MITKGATQPVDGNGAAFAYPNEHMVPPGGSWVPPPAWPFAVQGVGAAANVGLWTPAFNDYNSNNEYGAIAASHGWPSKYEHNANDFGLGFPEQFYSDNWTGNSPYSGVGAGFPSGTVVSTSGFVNPRANFPNAANAAPPVSHTHQLTFSTNNWLLEFPVLDRNTLWQMQAASDLFQATTTTAATTDEVTLLYNQENSAEPFLWGRTDGAIGVPLSTEMQHTPIYFITYYEGFQWW